MAKIPTTRRFGVEDFPDQKEWIEKLLSPLNTFIIAVVQGLNKSLTFSENLNSQIKDLTIKTKSSETTGLGTLPDYVELQNSAVFLSTIKGIPSGVIVLRCQDVGTGALPLPYGISVQWDFNDGQITISSVSGLQVNREYTIRVLVIGG